MIGQGGGRVGRSEASTGGEAGGGGTVGIIGGMGPLATVAFYRTLVQRTAALRDQDHLRVLIDADPAIPDRTAFLTGNGPDPRPALIRVARRLEAAGAQLLVMPCNTANVFADDVAAAVGIPLVPWIRTAVTAVAATHPRRVGLLATTGTLRTRVYQRAFEQAGIETLRPSGEVQQAIMDAIYGSGGVKASGGLDAANYRRLLASARSLARAGADVLLLGCTELPLAVDADSPDWPVPTIDPASAVADVVIESAGLRVRSFAD